MNPGDRVRLLAFGDAVIERRVVFVAGKTVVVCTVEEYDQAKQWGRKPIAVGFPIADIVSVDGVASTDGLTRTN